MQGSGNKELDNLLGKMEPVTPSMRFTKNVMESIENRQVAPVSKKYISPFIVKLVFTISALSIIILSTYIIYDPSPDYMPAIKNTGMLSASIIFINIILVLALAEKLLSRKKRLKQLLEE